MLVCWYCVCVVLCQLSPFWPRILFGFRFLQSGIALFGIFLSIKFNSITIVVRAEAVWKSTKKKLNFNAEWSLLAETMSSNRNIPDVDITSSTCLNM